MRLNVPERRESQFFGGVGNGGGQRFRYEVLEKFSEAFLFHGIGLADFFDGERVSRNAAVNDPNVQREFFEAIGSFGEGFFPIPAEIGYRSAKTFHGISDSLRDGVSKTRSDGDFPGEFNEFALGVRVEFGGRMGRGIFEERLILRFCRGILRKEFADSKNETRAEGFGKSDGPSARDLRERSYFDAFLESRSCESFAENFLGLGDARVPFRPRNVGESRMFSEIGPERGEPDAGFRTAADADVTTQGELASDEGEFRRMVDELVAPRHRIIGGGDDFVFAEEVAIGFRKGFLQSRRVHMPVG